ncbi:hypothetical protein ABK040_010632 [Willaertia magna]
MRNITFFLIVFLFIYQYVNFVYSQSENDVTPNSPVIAGFTVAFGDSGYCTLRGTSGNRLIKPNPNRWPTPGWNLIYYYGFSCPARARPGYRTLSPDDFVKLGVGYNFVIGLEYQNLYPNNGTVRFVGNGDNTNGQLAIDRIDSTPPFVFDPVLGYEIEIAESLPLTQMEALLDNTTLLENNVNRKFQDWRYPKIDDFGLDFNPNSILQNFYTCRDNTFIILRNGEIYGMGSNRFYSLSVNNTEQKYFNRPTRLIDIEHLVKIDNDWVKQFYCGHNVNFLITNNNRIIVFGRNDLGQLGLGPSNLIGSGIKPIVHPFLTYYSQNIAQVTKFSFGFNTTYVLFEDGSVFCSGLNDVSQCGLGINDNIIHTFTRLPFPVKVEQVSSTGKAVFFKTQLAKFYSAGSNRGGVLGLGSYNENFVASTPIYMSLIGHSVDGTIHDGFQQWHLFYQNFTGVYGIGSNHFGQLGISPTTDKELMYPYPIVHPMADVMTSIINGHCTFRGWGLSSLNCDKNVLIPHKVHTYFNGSYFEIGQCNCYPGWEDFSCHKLIQENSCNRKTDNDNFQSNLNFCSCDEGYYGDNCEYQAVPRKIYSFTRNKYLDKYSVGERMFDFTQLSRISSTHSFALSHLNNKKVYVFGTNNEKGQFANGYATKNMLQNTIQIATAFEQQAILENSTIVKVFPMKTQSILFLSNQKVYVTLSEMNNNSNLRLLMENVKNVFCSEVNCFMIDINDDVYGIFNNLYNQLGLKEYLNNYYVDTPTKVSLLKKDVHGKIVNIYPSNVNTFFVNEFGSCFCIGNNGNYQLGLGHNRDIKDFIVPILLSRIIVQVKSNEYFTTLLTLDSNYFHMGKNIIGTPLNADFVKFPTLIGILASEKVYLLGNDYTITKSPSGFNMRYAIGNQLLTEPSGKIVDVGRMGDELIGIIAQSQNIIYCEYGSLSLNGDSCVCEPGYNGTKCDVPICDLVNCTDGCIGPNICKRKTGTEINIDYNSLHLFGDPYYLQGYGATRNIFKPFVSRNIQAHTSGKDFSMFIEYNNSVSIKMIGENLYGQFGLGGPYQVSLNKKIVTAIPFTNQIIENTVFLIPILYDGEQLDNIVAGYNFVIVLTKSGSLYSVGDNSFGQLGLGDTSPRYFLTKINLGEKVLSVNCQSYHCISVGFSGKVYSWGNNHFSQICQSNGNNILQPTVINFSHLPVNILKNKFVLGENITLFFDNIGNLYSCGYVNIPTDYYNNGYLFRKLPLFNLGNNFDISQVPDRFYSSLCLKNGNSSEIYYCFGKNEQGQLGFGNLLNINGSSPVKHPIINSGIFYYLTPNITIYSNESVLSYFGDGKLLNENVNTDSILLPTIKIFANNFPGRIIFKDIAANHHFGYIVTNQLHCNRRGVYSLEFNGACSCNSGYTGNNCEISTSLSTNLIPNGIPVIISNGQYSSIMHLPQFSFDLLGNIPNGFNMSRDNWRLTSNFNQSISLGSESVELLFQISTFSILNVDMDFYIENTSVQRISLHTQSNSTKENIYKTTVTFIDTNITSIQFNIEYFTTGQGLDKTMENQLLKGYYRVNSTDNFKILGNTIATKEFNSKQFLESEQIQRMNMLYQFHSKNYADSTWTNSSDTLLARCQSSSSIQCDTKTNLQTTMITSITLDNSDFFSYSLFPILNDIAFKELVSFKSNAIKSIQYPIDEVFNFDLSTDLKLINISNNYNLEQSSLYFDLSRLSRNDIFIDGSYSNICDIPFVDLITHGHKYNFNNTNMFCMNPSLNDERWCKPIVFKNNVITLPRFFEKRNLVLQLDHKALCLELLTKEPSQISYYMIYPNNTKVDLLNEKVKISKRNDGNVELVISNFNEQIFIDASADYIDIGLLYTYPDYPIVQSLNGTIRLNYLKKISIDSVYPYIQSRASTFNITLRSNEISYFTDVSDLYCITDFSFSSLVNNVCSVTSGPELNQKLHVGIFHKSKLNSALSMELLGNTTVYTVELALIPNIITLPGIPTVVSTETYAPINFIDIMNNDRLELMDNSLNQYLFALNDTDGILSISEFRTNIILDDVFASTSNIKFNDITLNSTLEYVTVRQQTIASISPLISFDEDVNVLLHLEKQLALSGSLNNSIELRCKNLLNGELFQATTFDFQNINCSLLGIGNRTEKFDLTIEAKIGGFVNSTWFSITHNALTFIHYAKGVEATLTHSCYFDSVYFVKGYNPSSKIVLKLNSYNIPTSEYSSFACYAYSSPDPVILPTPTLDPNEFVCIVNFRDPGINYFGIAYKGVPISSNATFYVLNNNVFYDSAPKIAPFGNDTLSVYYYHTIANPYHTDPIFTFTYSCVIMSLDNGTVAETNELEIVKIDENHYYSKWTFRDLKNITLPEVFYYASIWARYKDQASQYIGRTIYFINPKRIEKLNPFIAYIPDVSTFRTKITTNDDKLFFDTNSKLTDIVENVHQGVSCLIFDIGNLTLKALVPMISTLPAKLQYSHTCDFSTLNITNWPKAVEVSLGSYIKEDNVIFEATNRTIFYTQHELLTFNFYKSPILKSNTEQVTLPFVKLQDYRTYLLNYELLPATLESTTIGNCEQNVLQFTCNTTFSNIHFSLPAVQKYGLQITLTYPKFNVSQLLLIDDYVYYEEILIDNYIPFVADYRTTTNITVVQGKLQTTRKLNELFTYVFKLENTVSNIFSISNGTFYVITDYSSFSKTTDSTASFNFVGLWRGHEIPITNTRSIRFTELFTSPNVLPATATITLQIVLDMAIPTPINSQYQLLLGDKTYFSCDIISFNTLSCTGMPPTLPKSINDIVVSLFDGNIIVTKFHLPVILYKTTAISLVSPNVLIAGTSYNTTVNIEDSSFGDISTLGYKVLCSVTDGNYTGYVVNPQSLQCEFSNLNIGRKTLSINLVFNENHRTPSISSFSTVDISKDFEVINQPKVSLYPSEQQTVYYTDREQDIVLTVSLTNTTFQYNQVLYDISKDLTVIKKDKLVDSITYLNSSLDTNSYNFTLSIKPSLDLEGFVPLRFVKRNGKRDAPIDTTDYIFTQIDELVLIFIKKITIFKSIPSFGVENVTRTVETISDFNFNAMTPSPSLHLDEKVTYTCEYTYVESNFSFSVTNYSYSSPASFYNNEGLICSIYSPNVGNILIDIFISRNTGEKLKINSNNLIYRVLDGLFLQPYSHGSRLYSYIRTVNPYNVGKYANSSSIDNLETYVDYLVKFDKFDINFGCNKVIDIGSTYPTLNCSIPILDTTELLSFKQYGITLFTNDNKKVAPFSIGWTPTGSLHISSLSPLIIQKSQSKQETKTFTFSILGDSRVTSSALPEGNLAVFINNVGLDNIPNNGVYENLQVSLAVQSSSLREKVVLQYVNFDLLSPIVDVETSYPDQFIYINDFDQTKVLFDENSKRGSIADSEKITVKITNNLVTSFMVENNIDSIKCYHKEVNQYITANITKQNDYIIAQCQLNRFVYSNSSAVSNIELWFISPLAENGRIKIASQTLSFYWFPNGLYTITNIDPTASLASLTSIYLTFNMQNLPKLTEGYECKLFNTEISYLERQKAILQQNSDSVLCPFSSKNVITGMFKLQLIFKLGNDEFAISGSYAPYTVFATPQPLTAVVPFVVLSTPSTNGTTNSLTFYSTFSFLPTGLSCLFVDMNGVTQMNKVTSYSTRFDDVSNSISNEFHCTFISDTNLSDKLMTSLVVDLGNSRILNISANAIDFFLYTKDLSWLIPDNVVTDMEGKYNLTNYYLPSSDFYVKIAGSSLGTTFKNLDCDGISEGIVACDFKKISIISVPLTAITTIFFTKDARVSSIKIKNFVIVDVSSLKEFVVFPYLLDFRIPNNQSVYFSSTTLDSERFSIKCVYDNREVIMSIEGDCSMAPNRDLNGNLIVGYKNVSIVWDKYVLSSNHLVHFIDTYQITKPVNIYTEPMTFNFTNVPAPQGNSNYYSFMIDLFDRTRYISSGNCSLTSSLMCTIRPMSLPPQPSTVVSYYLTINSVTAFRFKGTTTFVNPLILSVSPSFILANTTTLISITGRPFLQEILSHKIALTSNSKSVILPTNRISDTTLQLSINLPESLYKISISYDNGATFASTGYPLRIYGNEFNVLDIQILFATKNHYFEVPMNTTSPMTIYYENSYSFDKCKVRFTDTVVSVTAACNMNSGILTTNIPILWYYDLVFPRLISFSVSFDDGKNYIENEQFKIWSYDPGMISTISLDQYLVSSKVLTTSLRVYGLPPISSDVIQTTKFSFINNKQESFAINCISHLYCPLDLKNLVFPGILPFEYYSFDKLRIRFKNEVERLFILDKPFITYKRTLNDTATLTIDRSNIVQGTNTPLIISSSIELNDDLNTVPNIFVEFTSVEDNSIVSYIASTSFLSKSSFTIYVDQIDMLSTVAGFAITALLVDGQRINSIAPSFIVYKKFGINLENQYKKAKAFASASTPITILMNELFPISKLPKTVKYKVVSLNNELFTNLEGSIDISYLFTTKKRDTKETMVSQISFVIPAVTNILKVDKSVVRFPATFNFGFSLIGDDQYVYTPLAYDDSIADPPIIINYSPLELPIQETTMTMIVKASSVINPDNTLCIYRDTLGTNNSITVQAISLGDSFSYSCLINTKELLEKLNIKNTLEFSLSMKSNTDESRQSYIVPIFQPFTIDSFTPLSGRTTGNYSVTFKGNFPIHPREEYYTSRGRMLFKCKFGIRECPKSCVRISSNTIECSVIASNPVSLVDIYLTRDNSHFAPSPRKFEYLGCGPGSEQNSFTDDCTSCKPGSYKNQTNGPCFACPIGYYGSEYGLLECKKCPDPIAITLSEGSTSESDCGCPAEKYYFDIFKKKCFPCPEGAECPYFNTTSPSVQKGYWNSKDEPYTFYSCSPADSCNPGAYGNCSYEYSGFRCGECADGYYRSTRKCMACSKLAPLYLTLLIVGALILFGIFFALSSIKVHHLSSLSIALFFFQVVTVFTKFDIEFPEEIKGLFAASSSSTLNFDFIQFQCIIPIGFVPLWIIKMCIPIMILAAFTFLYIFGEIRNIFAKYCGSKIRLKKLGIDSLFKESMERLTKEDQLKKIPEKIKFTLAGIKLSIKKSLYKLQHSFVDLLTTVSTRQQMKEYLNKCIHSFVTLLSLAYMYIIQTSADIFLCKDQPNGTKSLEQAPYITCFEGSWWVMFPFSVVYFVIFGLGAGLFFTYTVKLQGIAWIRTFALVMTIVIFVGTSAILILLVLWDIRTRMKKEDKKIKQRMETMKKNTETETDNVEYSQQYKEMVVFGIELDELDDEDPHTEKNENINDVLLNLFSKERRRRKASSLKTKGNKILKKIKKKKRNNQQGNDDAPTETASDSEIELETTADLNTETMSTVRYSVDTSSTIDDNVIKTENTSGSGSGSNNDKHLSVTTTEDEQSTNSSQVSKDDKPLNETQTPPKTNTQQQGGRRTRMKNNIFGNNK